MNLFLLSSTPSECAEFHCDKHVIKMGTEIFTMMVAALVRHSASTNDLPKTKSGSSPKPSHVKHPVTLWYGDSYCNFMKGADFGLAICQEYTKRYGKTHFCEAGIRFMRDNIKSLIKTPFSKIEMTPYAIAINQDCLCRKLPFFESLHTIEKYRCYYILDKANIATWKFTEKPYWFSQDYLDWIGEQYTEWKQEYLCKPY